MKRKPVMYDGSYLGHAVTLYGVKALLAANGHAEMCRDEMRFKNHVVEGPKTFFVTSGALKLPRRARA